jgi:outer membrane lipopolysaccharide assembly protein LptE/RlpB
MLLKKPDCSKIARSSHPQYNSLRRLSVTKRELCSSRRDRTGTVLLNALRKRSSATPHVRAFEDGGEMAVYQQPLRGFRRFTVLLLCCLPLVAGCGYHFAGTAGNRIATDQSVWVAFIVNETISPTAQTVIRRALYEECHAMRGLYPADKEATAELGVRGKLTSYNLKAVSYSAIDQVKEYRLLISVDLELYRKGETAPVWKGTIQASQDFPASTELALQYNAEEAALKAASRTLARKFLVSVEQAY